MMEIRIETDLDSMLPDRIDFNYEELKEQIESKLSEYVGKDTTTDDNYQSRKEDRARLNRLATILNNERKEIKNRLLAPLTASDGDCLSFSAQIDDLVDKIAKSVCGIDEGIKQYEQRKRDAKKKEIDSYLDEACDVSGIANVHKHMVEFANEQCDRKKNSWLNVTCAMSQVMSEIDEELKRCESVFHAVENTYSNESDSIKAVAMDSVERNGFDFLTVTQDVNRYKEIEESAKKQREEAERKSAEQMGRSIQISEPIGKEGAEPPVLYSCTMRFVGTLAAFENLKEYIGINPDITFKVIEQMKEVNRI